MLAGLAEGTSALRNFSAAVDCHSTLGCMSALGAEVKVEKELVRVTGRGPRGLQSSWRALDAGNSGTTMRLLAGILAGQEFSTKLTGDGSLQKRPMKRVVGPLREMGADIRAKDDNFAPLEIKGARLHAIDYQMPMASAQVKSAVLLAGMFAEGVTSVTEPARTRDHTELALEEFGAAVERHGRTTKIHGLFGKNGAGKLVAKSLDVPGDISSAVFFRQSSPRTRGPITTGVRGCGRDLPHCLIDTTRHRDERIRAHAWGPRRSPGRHANEPTASRSTRRSWPGFPDRYGLLPHPSAHRRG